MLFLARADVEALLDVDRLIDRLEAAFRDVSAGRASMPPRIASFVADRDALLGVMPAFVPGLGVLEAKLVSVFPHNEDRPTHQAVIVCFDPTNGSPTALLDAEYITAVRTAAASAVATRLLARDDSRVMTIVGTGVQARSHARMIARVLSLDQILITGRDAASAARLADELRDLDTEVAGVESQESAVRAADIVCTTTHSPEPVIEKGWLRKGAHVNSVGVNPAGGEIDPATVSEARLFAESRAAVLAPSPAGARELIDAVAAGTLDERGVTELGEVLEGTAAGRTSETELTLYKSVGIAAEDAAAAALVLEAAAATGRGTEVEL